MFSVLMFMQLLTSHLGTTSRSKVISQQDQESPDSIWSNSQGHWLEGVLGGQGVAGWDEL